MLKAKIHHYDFQLACQQIIDDDGECDMSEESEYDTMVIENAGDVLPSLAKVVGGEKFVPIFAELLPEFIKRMVCCFRLLLYIIFLQSYNKLRAILTLHR